MTERVLIGAILAVCLVALYITAPEQSEAERQVEEYCEMVDAWHDSNGDIGWPPYDGEC